MKPVQEEPVPKKPKAPPAKGRVRTASPLWDLCFLPACVLLTRVDVAVFQSCVLGEHVCGISQLLVVIDSWEAWFWNLLLLIFLKCWRNLLLKKKHQYLFLRNSNLCHPKVHHRVISTFKQVWYSYSVIVSPVSLVWWSLCLLNRLFKSWFFQLSLSICYTVHI